MDWSRSDGNGVYFFADSANVTIRPDQLRNPNIPVDQPAPPARWFDVSAFSAPAPGRFGTAAKGVIFGPGSSIVNAGLGKNFKIQERWLLRWEMTATNFSNTTNYNRPNANSPTWAESGS